MRSKTVEFYILNSRGSPEGYPTIDFLHIQLQTTTFDHTRYNFLLADLLIAFSIGYSACTARRD